jgi:hypothetical protein
MRNYIQKLNRNRRIKTSVMKSSKDVQVKGTAQQTEVGNQFFFISKFEFQVLLR